MIKTIVTKIPSREAFLKGRDTLKIGYPWLTYGAIIAIEGIINKGFKVLEFGSGGSTVFWANNCQSVKSYETNPDWYKITKKKLEKFKNAEIVFGNRLENLLAINNEPDNYYDLILIDAEPSKSYRLDLAKAATNKLKLGGFLVLDNYMRFGLNDFDYSNFEVYTFDEFGYTGHGTRLCKKLT